MGASVTLVRLLRIDVESRNVLLGSINKLVFWDGSIKSLMKLRYKDTSLKLLDQLRRLLPLFPYDLFYLLYPHCFLNYGKISCISENQWIVTLTNSSEERISVVFIEASCSANKSFNLFIQDLFLRSTISSITALFLLINREANTFTSIFLGLSISLV